MNSSLSLQDKWVERRGQAQVLADRAVSLLAPVGPLLLRVWLAQEFVQAGWIKLSGGWSAPDWFTMLSFPVPVRWLPADVNWITAGLLEVTLGLLLLVGIIILVRAAGTRAANSMREVMSPIAAS